MNAISWAGVGFVVGFLVGRSLLMPNMNERVLGYVVLALTLTSIGVGVKTMVDRQDDVECLSGYIAENARVAKIRAAATVKRDGAIDALLGGVTPLLSGKQDPKKSQATLRKVSADYQRQVAEVRAERARNPLPELPATCADLEGND